jgi:DmsE family decaheme c-type cytochrome
MVMRTAWLLLALCLPLAGLAAPAEPGSSAAVDVAVDEVSAESDRTDPHAGLSANGADTCLSCHTGERMRVIFRTAHGQQADPRAPMASLQCEVCHGPGGDHSDRRRTGSRVPAVTSFGSGSATPVAEQDEICSGCHHRDLGLTWHGSVHERNETGCTGCHEVHAETDPVARRTSQAEVCFECHRAERADSLKPSAHPIRFDAMVCTDCHSPHASVADALLVEPTTKDLCVTCHAEYRGPMLFDHAPVSEDCALCHQPHGSVHPALLTRRPPLLCQSCHSQRGHPSLSFTDQSLPDGNTSAMVMGRSCMNCHTQVHGSNHPSGFSLMR